MGGGRPLRQAGYATVLEGGRARCHAGAGLLGSGVAKRSKPGVKSGRGIAGKVLDDDHAVVAAVNYGNAHEPERWVQHVAPLRLAVPERPLGVMKLIRVGEVLADHLEAEPGRGQPGLQRPAVLRHV
jgi:hypothetical protein